MGDQRIRALERAAFTGDAEAAEALSRERARRADQVEFSEFQVLRAKGVDLQAPAELSSALDNLLAADLAPLGELAGDAQRFVNHGDSAEVLDLLSRRHYHLLRLAGGGASHDDQPRPLLAGGLCSSPALLRLGLIYSAVNPYREPSYPGVEEGPNWFRNLLYEASRFNRDPGDGVGPFGHPCYTGLLSCATLSELLEFAGEDPLNVLKLFLDPSGPGGWRIQTGEGRIAPEGLNELVLRFSDHVRERLSENYYTHRLNTFERLLSHDCDMEPFFPEIARLAGLGRRSGGWFGTVFGLLRDRFANGQAREVQEALEGVLRNGTPDEREVIALFLGEVCGQGARSALQRAAARDRAPRVRKAAARALDAMTLLSGNPDLDLAPLTAPGPRAEEAFRAAFRDHPDLDLDQAWALIVDPAPWAPLPVPLLAAELSEAPLSELLDDFVRVPSVTLGHLARVIRLTGRLETWENNWRIRDQLLALDALAQVWFEAQGQPASLSRLGEAWGFLGLDARLLGRIALAGDVLDRWLSADRGWDCADYYERYPETLIEGLTKVPSGVNAWRNSLLAEIGAILEQLGAVPDSLHEAFFDLALCSAKSTRGVGQGLLTGEGDWVDEALIDELRARSAPR
ncbi:MAG: hypothetical protein JKY65_08655, partial [Planctomycetes bacterium]|nr:hypothetical protein [Planctomycetota bacterium]